MKTRFHLLAVTILALAQSRTDASLQSPLHIGTTNVAINQFGLMLPGSDPSAIIFNQPVVVGDLVEIIRTYNGSIDAPDAAGNPVGTNNVIIATSRIGVGADAAAGQIGQFGITLPNYDGSKIFCRMFNAPDLASSSFYGNSQVFTPAAGYGEFIPVVATLTPLDAAVTDPSGLNNSWIKLLGGAPTNFPAPAGNAAQIYAQYIASTTPGNIASYVKMTAVAPTAGGDASVYWFSITGQVYQVEYTTDLTSGNYSTIGPSVTATEWVSQTVQPNGAANLTNAFYRVKLLGQ